MKTYSIVGMNWLATEMLIAKLNVGTMVTLVREPNNPADVNAVAVYVEGVKAGYIPKKQNVVLSQFIDQRGESWSPPPPQVLALDGKVKTEPVAPQKAIPAKFVRSPNSGYPQVEVGG